MKNEYYVTHSVARAETFLKSGFNCAQSVLLAYQQRFNMDFSCAYKIAGGFGGGMAFGEVCGAVSGAIMIIGLQYSEIEDITPREDAKILTMRKSAAFIKAFKEKHRSVLCRELIDYDFSKNEIKKMTDAEKERFVKCPQFVESAVILINEMIN